LTGVGCTFIDVAAVVSQIPCRTGAGVGVYSISTHPTVLTGVACTFIDIAALLATELPLGVADPRTSPFVPIGTVNHYLSEKNAR
jgi:hypothetical protein